MCYFDDEVNEYMKGGCTNAVENLWALLNGGIGKRWKGPRGQE